MAVGILTTESGLPLTAEQGGILLLEGTDPMVGVTGSLNPEDDDDEEDD